MAAKWDYIQGAWNASSAASTRVEYCRITVNDYSDINMERNVRENIWILADELYFKKKKKKKNKTAEQTCTGLSLCIKVHNSGGLVAAPGELLGFRDSLKKEKRLAQSPKQPSGCSECPGHERPLLWTWLEETSARV